MYRYIRSIFVIVSFAAAAAAMPADEITDILSRAESLYFEAKFKDAIQLLQHADDMLKARTDRNAGTINLTYGAALMSFEVRADLAHQCTEMGVSGWDVA